MTDRRPGYAAETDPPGDGTAERPARFDLSAARRAASLDARWQGSAPRVMQHRPLPDCRVRGLHYCHSRYKGAEA